MIGSLRGILSELEPGNEHSAECVVEVGGVGYRVIVGSRLAAEIGPVGREVSLAVHTHVREGAITLYGFADPPERRCFELLIGAHGVGPALAIAMLSVHRPEALAARIADGDLDALCLVPGVGKKTAQRLLVELGPRFTALAVSPALQGNLGARALVGARGEVGEALAALGYGRDEVRNVLEGFDEEFEGGIEAMLRAALRELAPRR